MNKVDIIIAGAGISGLLIGHELSKKLSILILEKQEEEPIPKYWVTQNNLQVEPEIKKNIDVLFTEMDFISHEFEKYSLTGDYALWNTNKLCNYLKSSINKNGGKIQYNHRVYSYSLKKNHIKVYANNRTYESKILIDCMGFQSPIVHTHSMIKTLGFHYLYGKSLKLNTAIKPICLANVVLQKEAEYIEVFPNSKGEAHVAIIKPVKKIGNLNQVKNNFDFIINKSVYSKYFQKSSGSEPELGGIVPVGIIKKKALERIFFYGESAQYNPASTGTCLTRLFCNYKTVAKFIHDSIVTDKLTAKSLSNYPSNFNRLSTKFQINLFKDMLSWNSVKFRNFLRMLEVLPDESVNDFLFEEIKFSHFTDMPTVLQLIKSKQVLWIKPLLKSLF